MPLPLGFGEAELTVSWSATNCPETTSIPATDRQLRLE